MPRENAGYFLPLRAGDFPLPRGGCGAAAERFRDCTPADAASGTDARNVPEIPELEARSVPEIPEFIERSSWRADTAPQEGSRCKSSPLGDEGELGPKGLSSTGAGSVAGTPPSSARWPAVLAS